MQKIDPTCEIDNYLYTAVENFQDNHDIVTYWEKSPYPTLKKIAFELLSVPSSTAFVERMFSVSKGILSDKRNKLSSETLKTLVLLHYWIPFFNK